MKKFNNKTNYLNRCNKMWMKLSISFLNINPLYRMPMNSWEKPKLKTANLKPIFKIWVVKMRLKSRKSPLDRPKLRLSPKRLTVLMILLTVLIQKTRYSKRHWRKISLKVSNIILLWLKRLKNSMKNLKIKALNSLRLTQMCKGNIYFLKLNLYLNKLKIDWIKW